MRGLGDVFRVALRACRREMVIACSVFRSKYDHLAAGLCVLAERVRRSDAVGAQLVFGGWADPVCCPCGGELGADAHVSVAGLQERAADVGFDLIDCGAAAVGGGDEDLDAAVCGDLHVAQDA